MKTAGFTTIGAGKVFHGPNRADNNLCWDHYLPFEAAPNTALSKAIQTQRLRPNNDFGPLDADAPNFDQTATNYILDRMNAKSSGQFWALGLYRPHLPFIVPQKFFDALPKQIANPPGLGINSFDPEAKSLWKHLPKAALKMIRPWLNTGRVLTETGEYHDFMRAYLASIHYADHLLGQVLDHMDDTNLWDNTHVILWSDHGWQLGEKLTFRKFSLWERALRIPLMIAGPNIKPDIIHCPVSLTDLAPTVLGIAKLPADATLSGQSLLSETLSGFATSIWGTDLDTDTPKHALSVRSKTHRLILYWDNSMELYDHRRDPYEHENLLFDPSETDLSALEPILDDLLNHMPETLVQPIK